MSLKDCTIGPPVEQGTGPTCTEPKFSGITISTWNIVDGRGNRLELACERLQQLEIDIPILTETKLCGRHTIRSYGYNIIATKCANQNQGGVAIVF